MVAQPKMQTRRAEESECPFTPIKKQRIGRELIVNTAEILKPNANNRGVLTDDADAALQAVVHMRKRIEKHCRKVYSDDEEYREGLRRYMEDFLTASGLGFIAAGGEAFVFQLQPDGRAWKVHWVERAVQDAQREDPRACEQGHVYTISYEHGKSIYVDVPIELKSGDIICASFKADSDLFDYLLSGELQGNWEEIVGIIFQIAECLMQLHKQNIAHRDIKAENILFKRQGDKKEWKFVLADFGFATKSGIRKDPCGTPHCALDPFCGPYCARSHDLYLLGNLCRVMITLSNSPSDINLKAMSNTWVCAVDPDSLDNPMEEFGRDYPDVKTLIVNSLHPIPTARPSIQEWMTVLEKLNIV